MLGLETLTELPLDYAPVEFLVREALHDWERAEAHALRRLVFCVEQGLFIHDAVGGGERSGCHGDDGHDPAAPARIGDDRDAIDDHAQLLVAMSCLGGQPDQVVGTVRIHRDAGVSDTWWGSRLAVHPAFRHQGHLGATLIRLAVGRARAQGCRRFLAFVQAQNEPMFQRLHWQTLGHLELHGRPHAHMAAGLEHYAACDDPVSGFVTRGRRAGAGARA